MKIYFKKLLFDLEGEPVKKSAEDSTSVDLRKVATEALLATFPDERSLSGEEKLKRWVLARKIRETEDPVTLTTEEVALVKKLIGLAYGTGIVGSAYSIIEEDSEDGVKE